MLPRIGCLTALVVLALALQPPGVAAHDELQSDQYDNAIHTLAFDVASDSTATFSVGTTPNLTVTFDRADRAMSTPEVVSAVSLWYMGQHPNANSLDQRTARLSTYAQRLSDFRTRRGVLENPPACVRSESPET